MIKDRDFYQIAYNSIDWGIDDGHSKEFVLGQIYTYLILTLISSEQYETLVNRIDEIWREI